MSITRREDLYRRARVLYGDDNQLEMVTEECGELIVALQHRKRGRGDVEAVEELADAIIMHEQARLILGAPEVDAAIARKLERLDERVTKGELARRTVVVSRTLPCVAIAPTTVEVTL